MFKLDEYIGMLSGSDTEIMEELIPWMEDVEAEFMSEIGTTHVFLDGRRSECGRSECNLGNLVTDSLVNHVSSYC